MTGAVNGHAAAQTMLGFGTWRRGHCLEAVWQAYKRNGAATDRNAATATIGWDLSDGKHHGDRNPPAGVPVWWGPKRSSSAGDVVISLGGGRVVATDWPYNGVIGVCTIDERERQIGRPYLGWTETILGAPIDYAREPAPTPTTNPTPTPEEEPEMYIADVAGSWYLVIGKQAHALAAKSGASRSGIPIIRYPDQWAKDQLTSVVSGIK